MVLLKKCASIRATICRRDPVGTRTYIRTVYYFLFGSTNLIVSRDGKVAALVYFPKGDASRISERWVKSWGDVNVSLSIVGVLIPARRVTRERPSDLLIGWTFSRKALRGCIHSRCREAWENSFSGLVLLRVRYVSYDSNILSNSKYLSAFHLISGIYW